MHQPQLRQTKADSPKETWFQVLGNSRISQDIHICFKLKINIILLCLTFACIHRCSCPYIECSLVHTKSKHW